MSFSKRSDTGPVCYTKPLDSLKHWNESFFWVDASAFSLSIPWHNNKTLKKDPHPTPTEFNAKMDLSAFINHADPTKVRIGGRKVKEGEVPLLESTRGRVVPLACVNEQGNQNDDVQDAGVHVDEVPTTIAEKAKGSRKKRKAAGGASGSIMPPKKLRADHGTFGAGASTGGKSVAALQGLLERSTLPVEVGVTAVATFSNDANAEVSSVVRSLVPDPPIMTSAIATMVVAAASSVPVHMAGNEPVHASIFADFTSAGTVRPDIAGPSQPASTKLSADTFYVYQDMDSKTLRQIYVPKWNMVNESVLALKYGDIHGIIVVYL
ncbi:hypothetical protein Tco_1177612 [Tanacetum coccineum]